MRWRGIAAYALVVREPAVGFGGVWGTKNAQEALFGTNGSADRLAGINSYAGVAWGLAISVCSNCTSMSNTSAGASASILGRGGGVIRHLSYASAN